MHDQLQWKSDVLIKNIKENTNGFKMIIAKSFSWKDFFLIPTYIERLISADKDKSL